MLRVSPITIQQFADKVLSRVSVVGQCWEWEGYRNPRGYGTITHGRGLRLYCHRIVCEAYHGLPEGYNACHKCDNPSCVRPEHLFPATQKENIHDAMAKGRHIAPPRTNWGTVMQARPHHWQKITAETAAEIKARLAKGTRVRDVVKEMNVSSSIVEKIKSGDRWRRA